MLLQQAQVRPACSSASDAGTLHALSARPWRAAQGYGRLSARTHPTSSSRTGPAPPAGHKISEVAGPLNKVAEAYGCQMVEGVMSHEMKQFVIDGNKCVLSRPSPEQKVEEGEFQVRATVPGTRAHDWGH